MAALQDHERLNNARDAFIYSVEGKQYAAVVDAQPLGIAHYYDAVERKHFAVVASRGTDSVMIIEAIRDYVARRITKPNLKIIIHRYLES